MRHSIRSAFVAALITLVTAAAAQAQPAQGMTGFIDVNVGVASAADSTRSTVATWAKFSETASARVTYNQPSGADFDFGGGLMFTPVFGVGLSFSGTAHQAAADLALSVPHPYYYNRAATDSNQTRDKLEYTEGAVHLQLILAVPTTSKHFSARFFVGPSHFQAKGDAVTDLTYDQAWIGTSNAVAITGYDSKKAEKSAWGFHAGGDVSYFFSRVVGLGAMVRISRGNATVRDSDVLANEPMKVKLGGVQAGAGLRLRFGHR